MMTNNHLILYVEDNRENRLLIRRILEAEGHTIAEAENATEAIDFIQSHTPDLILMDINMPDIDGYTLTTQMRMITQLDHVPIVAITANVMKGDRERTLSAGCDGYIQKPIDVDELPKQISQFLNN